MEGASGATGFPCRPSSPSIRNRRSGIRHRADRTDNHQNTRYLQRQWDAAAASSLPDWRLADRRSPDIGVGANIRKKYPAGPRERSEQNVQVNQFFAYLEV